MSFRPVVVALAALAALSPAVAAATESGRALTLSQALELARANQPALREAAASTAGARARVDQATAPMRPQISASANYEFGAGTGARRSITGESEFGTYHSLGAGLRADQLIYDFGRTGSRRDAAAANVQAQVANEHAAELALERAVRVSYFEARATRELLEVARENLAGSERHLMQIDGFVRAGARAEIDLVQARTDVANAQVDLIDAENGYATALANLNHAMGIAAEPDYTLADDAMPEVAGERAPLETLVAQACAARPELVVIERQIAAQQLTQRGIEGDYYPSLGAYASAGEAGLVPDDLEFSVSAGLSLRWPIYEGGITDAQVSEVRANLAVLHARADAVRLDVRLEVKRAQLAVRAADAARTAADEAARNARELLRLAEGRYQTGVGSVIELADAQLGLVAASAQRVQAEYSLAAARAELLAALGRKI